MASQRERQDNKDHIFHRELKSSTVPSYPSSWTFLEVPDQVRRTSDGWHSHRMKLSNKLLFAAAVCCLLCVLLSVLAIAANQIAFSQIDPNNRLGLCQDGYYTAASWAFLLYDLPHIFVIVVFALVLAQTFSWEAWMGGGALIISSLADLSSLSVNMFFLMAALRAMAQGKSTGLVTPEAGYEVICSTLDFAQASFGLVGTLFLATAAIKASGMAKVAGWFLLIGLPISLIQVAEVGTHTPWTAIVDTWVTPIDKIVLHIVLGMVFFALLRNKIAIRVPETRSGFGQLIR
jgi:hypothetical protein